MKQNTYDLNKFEDKKTQTRHDIDKEGTYLSERACLV